MLAEKEIYSLVVAAVNEVVAQAGKNEQGPLTRSTQLLGDHSILDSISFVIFIVELERTMPASYQLVTNLTEHEGILDPSGPFRTIGTLCDHLSTLNGAHVRQA